MFHRSNPLVLGYNSSAFLVHSNYVPFLLKMTLILFISAGGLGYERTSSEMEINEYIV